MEDVELSTFVANWQNPDVPCAAIGVRARHLPSGIEVQCERHRTQHKNATSFLEELKLKLVKARFSNIDDDDLVDGDTFFAELEEGLSPVKYALRKH